MEGGAPRLPLQVIFAPVTVARATAPPHPFVTGVLIQILCIFSKQDKSPSAMTGICTFCQKTVEKSVVDKL